MASRYQIRRRAEEDITDILCYIADKDPKAAFKLYEKFLSLFALLSKFPEIGRPREELAPEIRSMPLGNYIIFFEAKKDLEIIRVLHGARDITEGLF